MSFFVGKRPSNGKPLLHINSVTPLNGSIQEAPDENTIFHSDLPFIFVEEYSATPYAQHINVNGVDGFNGASFNLPSEVITALQQDRVVLVYGENTATGSIFSFPQINRFTSYHGKSWDYSGWSVDMYASTYVESERSSIGMDYIMTPIDTGYSVEFCNGNKGLSFRLAGWGYQGSAPREVMHASYNGGFSLLGAPRMGGQPQGRWLRVDWNGDTAIFTEPYTNYNLPTSFTGFLNKTTRKLFIPYRGLEYYNYSLHAPGGGRYSIGTTSSITEGGTELQRGSGVLRNVSVQCVIDKLSFIVLNITSTSSGFSYIPNAPSSEVYLSRDTFQVGNIDLANTRILSEAPAISYTSTSYPKRVGFYGVVTACGFTSIDISWDKTNNTKYNKKPIPIVNRYNNSIVLSNSTTDTYMQNGKATVVQVQDTPNIVGSWKADSNSLTITKGTSELFSPQHKPLKFLSGVYSFTFSTGTSIRYASTANTEYTLATWDIGLVGASVTLLVSLHPTGPEGLVQRLTQDFDTVGASQSSNPYLGQKPYTTWGCRDLPRDTVVNNYKNVQVMTFSEGDCYMLQESHTKTWKIHPEYSAPPSSIPSIVYLKRQGSTIKLCIMGGIPYGNLGVVGLKLNFMRLT